MRFTKMQGAGNDYVYVDCFAQPTPADPSALARALADRHFGVGGDGMILIVPHDAPDVDAEMRMYNVDGSFSEMCGNGMRCVAKYVYDHGIAQRDTLRIASAGNVYELQLFIENGLVDRVRVDMGQPILEAAVIPTKFEGHSVVDAPFLLEGRTLTVTCVSMSNPHCVVYLPELTDAEVLHLGPLLERNECFPNRTNVEFVEVLNPTRVRQRTWERGSGETLACGTGASAVCVAGVLSGRTQREIDVELLGGTLHLEWNEQDNHVYMTGPAVEVFSGDWPD